MKEYMYFEGERYDVRHGGPFDRGSADSYYGRALRPHYFVGRTATSDEVLEKEMTVEERKAYFAGYKYNERFGEKKDWGVR